MCKISFHSFYTHVECSCNNNGTKNGTVICNKGSGQCPCKDNIHQRTCSECKDGFYSFPTTVDADCLLCDCDYGGSIKEICEKENGLFYDTFLPVYCLPFVLTVVVAPLVR